MVVSVRDTGIGIAAEHLPRIFEMFSQVDPALERSQGGLGIGLTLVSGLVEMHGGTVEARSEGSARAASSSSASRRPRPRPSSRPRCRDRRSEAAAGRSPCRILVVDDNRDAADSLAMLLGVWATRSRRPTTAVEAVHAAAGFRPDWCCSTSACPG